MRLKPGLVVVMLFGIAFYVALGLIVAPAFVPRNRATPFPPQPTPTLNIANYSEVIR